jgi:hypothetical protein
MCSAKLPCYFSILLAISGTTTCAVETVNWSEFVSKDGGFRVLLPNKPTHFEQTKPLEESGDEERSVGIAGLKHRRAVASFLATSMKKPQAYLQKYTAQQRIDRVFDATMSDCRQNFPNATIKVERKARTVDQQRAPYWKIVVTDKAAWLELQTVAFYVDDVFYAAEVIHFSSDSSRATSQGDIDMFFSSFAVRTKNVLAKADRSEE